MECNMEGHMEFTNDRVREYRGYKIKATDPYGFWSIHATKGAIPAILEGSFTGLREAKQKIDIYLDSKEQKANAPARDKNTRKVQEILAGTGAGAG
jgi:hypothetical protein